MSRVLGVLCCVMSLPCIAAAQGAGEPRRCINPTEGQWLGPYDLRPEINLGETGSPPFATPRYSEIAHAMLLPPPNDGWVLLWCARYCGDVAGQAIPPYQTFLWHPDNPTSVLYVSLPSVSPEGSGDLFCGGQAFTANGDPVLFGGTDIPAACAPGADIAQGHGRVWLFQNANSLRQWVLNPTEMLRKRWYASCILLPDGRLLVAGHVGQPDDVTLPTRYTREHGAVQVDAIGTPELVWDPESATKNFKNWRQDAGGSCIKDPTLDAGVQGMIDYVQLHVMRGGSVFAVATGRPGVDVRSAILDFDECPFDPDEETERWIVGPSLPFLQTPKLEGSPSIHIVNAKATPPTEVFYSIAGNDAEGNCDPTTTNRVLVMVDPDPGKAWTLDAPLTYARNSCNAVLASDGSIIVFGGLDLSCLPVYEPERLRPPAVFSTGNTSTWTPLCPQAHLRAYHSWALTLPDGKIISGGGIGCPPGTCFGANNHSIEVYSPPYLFRTGRPVIVNWPDPLPAPENGEQLELQVALPGTLDPEFRVALMQPGAVTHSYNTNQRYVILSHDEITEHQPYPAPTTITVNIPDSGIAPPGWYMLVVVSSDGVPSIARWLKIVPAQS